ncbi:Scr1 family TA system antitoxin-like transcriptional regulator [Nocardia sp. R7R-8]|uniref:Scr1 family TA system antitoxin-like transcriptional regulator n=1 Tax=Nocardia sp. R7R-8 TaxID=3459304 RepID=UPI00403DD9DF
MAAGRPDDRAAEIERRVQLRIKRQSLTTRTSDPVEMDVVIHESVLRQIIGSARVMAEQIRALVDASRRPNIAFRVLPFAAGYPTGDQIGPFTILEFSRAGKDPVEPPVVYMEGFTGALYVDKPTTVQRYGMAYEAIRGAALDVQESRRLLRDIEKEYGREH